ATWFWHVPAVYDWALRSSDWHYFQHICFIGAALLFWYPIVRPYPARPRWSSWLLLPVLFFADLSYTALSPRLTSYDLFLYRYYAAVSRLGAFSAVEDQSAAGVLMWVPGSVAFLLPLFGIGIRLLSGQEGDGEIRRQGDSRTRRRGNKETRRAGSRISLRPAAPRRTSGCSSACLPASLPALALLREL